MKEIVDGNLNVVFQRGSGTGVGRHLKAEWERSFDANMEEVGRGI